MFLSLGPTEQPGETAHPDCAAVYLLQFPFLLRRFTMSLAAGTQPQMELFRRSREVQTRVLWKAPSDDELVRRLQAGDERAFLTVYDAHQERIYRFALRMSGRAEVAEEVAQETFLRLVNGTLKYRREQGSLGAFLFGVVRNLTWKHLAIDRGTPQIEEQATDEADPLSRIEMLESIDALKEAMMALPALQREVVVLCHLEEMSYEEAAKLIDCPVGTVRSRLSRARSELARQLAAAEVKR